MHWRTHLYLHQPCHCTFMAYLGVACCRYCLNPVLFADNCSWVRQIPSIYVCMYIYIGILYRWSQFGESVWQASLLLPNPSLVLVEQLHFSFCSPKDLSKRGVYGSVHWWAGTGQVERCNPVGSRPVSFTYHQVTKSFFPSAKHFPLSHPFFPTCVFCSSLLTWLAKSHSVSADWSGSTRNI